MTRPGFGFRERLEKARRRASGRAASADREAPLRPTVPRCCALDGATRPSVWPWERTAPSGAGAFSAAEVSSAAGALWAAGAFWAAAALWTAAALWAAGAFSAAGRA